MITRIDHLTQLANFADFKWDTRVLDFGKINLIFGYNGSGKTTISNVFRLYSAQRDDGDDSLFQDLSNTDDATACIRLDDEPVPYSAGCERRNIYVFNADFIIDHVFEGTRWTFRPFDTTVVTEEQLKNPEIEELEKQIRTARKRASDKQAEKDALESKFEEIKSALSQELNSRIKGSRCPSMTTVPSAIPATSAQEARINLDAAYDEYALSQKQEELKQDLKELDSLAFTEAGVDLGAVANVLSQSISEESRKKIQQKLDDLAPFEPTNSTLRQWFEDGYRLLQHVNAMKQERCPLCDSDLRPRIEALIADYEAFYSEEYARLTGTIAGLVDTIALNLEAIGANHAAAEMLQTLERKYSDVLQTQEINANTEGGEVRKALERAKEQLLDKQGAIAKTSWAPAIEVGNPLPDYNATIADLAQRKSDLVAAIAAKAFDPDALLKEVRERLQQSAYAQFNDHGAGQQVQNYRSIEEELGKAEGAIVPLEAKRNAEIAKLRNESRYVNQYLKRLGVDHFDIVMPTGTASDNILIQFRSGRARSRLRHSLSESEKTTLAFAYFLSKIQYEVKENAYVGMGSVILVIDDPISSLDENRLHVTACLIHSLSQKAHQTFVLSHNLTFMKFFSNVVGNPRAEVQDRERGGSRRDYYLCSHEGRLTELPEGLRNYRTTYFHKLHEVIRYHEGAIRYEAAKSFLPNYIRTVLETFLSFKFCVLTQGSSGNKYRSPGLDRLANFLKGKRHLFARFDKVGDIDSESLIPTLERIKRITDPQAHGSPQDLDDISFVSERELRDITRDTLDTMGFLDGIHFDEVKGQ